MEHEPEAVIGGIAVLEDVIKLLLGGAFDGLPMVQGWRDASFVQRGQDDRSIGKKKSIAAVEENRFQLGHSIHDRTSGEVWRSLKDASQRGAIDNLHTRQTSAENA